MVSQDDQVDPYRFTMGKFINYLKPVKSTKDVANDQWNRVLTFVRRGKARELVLHGATDIAVRSLGGIDVIGDTHPKDLDWKRKQFIEVFESNITIGDIDKIDGPDKFGVEYNPKRIGQPNNLPPGVNKALEVMSGGIPEVK